MTSNPTPSPTPGESGPDGTGAGLGPADLALLAAVGIPQVEAERQLALLRTPPPPVRLVRPCTPGDGVERIADDRRPGLRARCREARERGRLAKMVPASGAASRMFKSLLSWLAGDGGDESLLARAAAGDGDAHDVQRLLAEMDRFPFRDALAAAFADRGERIDTQVAELRAAPILAVLLGDNGLAYVAAPKGLLPFHRYGDEVRTAFGEHLVEAARLVADGDGRCRAHFTVPGDRRNDFAAELDSIRGAIEARFGVRLGIDFSSQDPATDTLAIELDGTPFRRPDGTLLLRPGGHGALLRNLDALDGDIVFLKNVDNVVREEALDAVLEQRELLAGLLLELEAGLSVHRAALADPAAPPPAIAAARTFLAERFDQSDAPHDRAGILARIDRPLRVCGVVINQGEPGGGPFWVADGSGRATPQIVESSQVDRRDIGQEAIFAASTHFNPVDIVCSLRDAQGLPYPLPRFVDPTTAFVSRKSEGGRELWALEHPGLWNGAMAGWLTRFVEIPVSCFAPVKTVFDLLRPEHQPPG